MISSLGIHTLQVEHAFLLALYCLLTLVNSRMHKGIRGIYWFSLYNVLAFVAALLVSFRGHISPLFSYAGADLLVISAFIVLFISLARLFTAHFTAHFNGLYLQLSLLVLSAPLLLQYGWLHPDLARRMLVYSLAVACSQAHTVWFTVRRNTPRSDAATSMAVILAILCLINLARVAYVAFHSAPGDYLRVSDQLALFVMANTALQCSVMVSYVWITASSLQKDLVLQASTDVLTGVLNRRAINLAAERVLARSNKNDHTSAISIDLDDFKQINDTHGHSCGDAALIALASRLQQGLRPGDSLGRMGGDEFVVLLPRTSLATARMIARRLQHLVGALDVLHNHTRVKLSASFGVAEMKNNAGGWDQLLGECDKLLYTAKRSRPRIIAPQTENFFPLPEEVLVHCPAYASSDGWQSAS